MGKDVLVLHRWVGQFGQVQHLHGSDGKRPLEGKGRQSMKHTHNYIQGAVKDTDNTRARDVHT